MAENQPSPRPRANVPVPLANFDMLLREAELEWLKYRQLPDKRFGAVPLESVSGGLDLIGLALNSVLESYEPDAERS